MGIFEEWMNSPATNYGLGQRVFEKAEEKIENRGDKPLKAKDFRSYWIEQARKAMEGQLGESPQDIAEKAGAAAAVKSGQDAAQLQELMLAAMSGTPQMQGAVKEAVRGQSDMGEETFQRAYGQEATLALQDRQRLEMQALQQGQAAAELNEMRRREREQLILAMLSGAVGGLGEIGLGDQPPATE